MDNLIGNSVIALGISGFLLTGFFTLYFGALGWFFMPCGIGLSVLIIPIVVLGTSWRYHVTYLGDKYQSATKGTISEQPEQTTSKKVNLFKNRLPSRIIFLASFWSLLVLFSSYVSLPASSSSKILSSNIILRFGLSGVAAIGTFFIISVAYIYWRSQRLNDKDPNDDN